MLAVLSLLETRLACLAQRAMRYDTDTRKPGDSLFGGELELESCCGDVMTMFAVSLPLDFQF